MGSNPTRTAILAGDCLSLHASKRRMSIIDDDQISLPHGVLGRVAAALAMSFSLPAAKLRRDT